MLSVLLSVFSILSQMIWGLIVANHCYAITNIILLFSCLFPSAQTVAFTGFFCSFGAGQRQYFLVTVFKKVLFQSSIQSWCVCERDSMYMFVWNSSSLMYILNVLRILLRINSNFFSWHQKLIAFDPLPSLTKFKYPWSTHYKYIHSKLMRMACLQY